MISFGGLFAEFLLAGFFQLHNKAGLIISALCEGAYLLMKLRKMYPFLYPFIHPSHPFFI